MRDFISFLIGLIVGAVGPSLLMHAIYLSIIACLLWGR